MAVKTLFINHGTSVGTWSIEVTDKAELKISHSKTLDGKKVTRITQVTGKNIGRANETTPLEQAHKEMASRIQKQLDKGYVETLEQADAPPVNSLGLLKPVLATVLEKVDPAKIDWSSAYLQKKLDGHRCMYSGGVLSSRGGKEINLPHILDAIKTAGLGDLQLDGELYVHKMPLQQIGSLIKAPREESLVLQYVVYDVPCDSRSFKERFVTGLNPVATLGTNIQILETVKVTNMREVRELTAKWVADGYEGSILRFGSKAYEFGKRSRLLLKIKEYQDAETKVVDWVETKTNTLVGEDGVSTSYKNFNYVCENPFGDGTFEVAAEGTHKEVDAYFNEGPDKNIGRKLTFKYFSLSDDNLPQQPVMLGWREDI